MRLKKYFNKTLTSVVITSAILTTTSAYAAFTINIAGQVKGNAPKIENVTATGILQVGSEISLPENYTTSGNLSDNVTDLDGDTPLSLYALNDLANDPNSKKVGLEKSKIKWFLFDDLNDYETIGNKFVNEDEYLTLVNEGKIIELPSFDGQTKITLPLIAYNKRIGFRVSARTETGLPINSEPVYVLNAFIPDNNEGPVDPTQNDNTPPGTIDLAELTMVYERRIPGGEWQGINEGNMEIYENEVIISDPVPGEEFRVSIKDTNNQSYDEAFKNSVDWVFYAYAGDEVNGEIIKETKEYPTKDNGYYIDEETQNDYFKIQIQTKNSESNIADGTSEQGLRLKVTWNKDNLVVPGTETPEESNAN